MAFANLILLGAPIILFAGVYIYLVPFRGQGLSLIPSCSFLAITGYLCPGCGGTRALMAFVEGRFFESIAYNPLIFAGVLALPMLMLESIFTWANSRRMVAVSKILGRISAGLLAIVFMWCAIGRNIL